jgi:hypothetical protein
MYPKIYTPSHQPIQGQPDSYVKGQMFEEYIIKLFNDRHFHLSRWRKAGQIDTLYYDHSGPDLEFVFGRKWKYRFAVECKWRKKFHDGKISWANNEQRHHYLDFQYRTHTPVFIAIGIGGEPSNPAKLFVTPLQQLFNNLQVYEFELMPFQRRPKSRFFYDTIQLKLF